MYKQTIFSAPTKLSCCIFQLAYEQERTRRELYYEDLRRSALSTGADRRHRDEHDDYRRKDSHYEREERLEHAQRKRHLERKEHSARPGPRQETRFLSVSEYEGKNRLFLFFTLFNISMGNIKPVSVAS